MKEVIDLSKFRKPTQHEINQISKSFEHYYSFNIKAGKYASTVLAVIGVMMLTNIGNANLGLMLVSLGCSVICFLLVYKMVKDKNDAVGELKIYQQGQFLVLDGYAERVETSSVLPGCFHVWFVSDDYTYHSPCHSVRMENVKRGSKLLLIQPNFTGTKLGRCYVFSEFMLTDEGAKLRGF